MRTNYLTEWKWPVHSVWINMFRPMTREEKVSGDFRGSKMAK